MAEDFDNSTTNLSSTGGSSNEDAEFCCIGCLIVSGDVSVTKAAALTVSYEGSVTVKTITMCLNGVPCTGQPSNYVSLSCDEIVKRLNEENSSPIIKGGYGGANPASPQWHGGRPKPPPHGLWEEWIQNGPDDWCVFWTEQYLKLGCCTGSCSDKSNSKTYKIKGTVVTADWGRSVVNKALADYGFGGTPLPQFAPCCKK